MLGSFVIFSGDPDQIAKKPYILVIFQVGSEHPPPLPLDPRMKTPMFTYPEELARDLIV